MRKTQLFVFVALAAAVLCHTAACKGDSPKETEPNLGFDPVSIKFRPDPLPNDLLPSNIEYRDQNCFISGDFFCVVSIVDNKSYDWVRIWNRLTVLDSADHVLSVNGDSSFIIRAFADAIPPSGASSFFCAIPLNQITGIPSKCHMEAAGVLLQEPGPILVVSESGGGIRVQRPDPKDPTKIIELAFNSQATIENPLPDTAQLYRLVYLVYGNEDQRLYFAQMIDPVKHAKSMRMDRTGPLVAGEKRRVFYPIVYEFLPEQLRTQRVGRADVQVYEVREK
ncbi:MAG: hypothetical protein ABMA02_01315 [Saprospiraceae bacterium]